MKNKMNFLIIGGSGFIGRNLSRNIITQLPDSKVFVLDRNIENTGLSSSRIGFIKKNDSSLVKNLEELPIEIDTIIHLGGISAPFEQINLKELIEKDLLFTIELLEWAKLNAVKKFIYFSSGGTIYGPVHRKTGHNESDLPLPRNNYALSKCLNELVIEKECNSNSITHLIIRPSNPFGPGQTKFNKQGVISTFLYRIMRKEPLITNGSLKNSKDYIYIDDLSNLVLKLIYNDRKGTYNIGSGTNTSLENILSSVEKVTKTENIRINNQLKETQTPNFALDNRKLLKDISENYEFTTLEKGIEETWEWMKTQNFNS